MFKQPCIIHFHSRRNLLPVHFAFLGPFLHIFQYGLRFTGTFLHLSCTLEYLMFKRRYILFVSTPDANLRPVHFAF